jgi:hypothetical protein
VIHSLEDKTQKEVVEICKIQIEEYQILTKRIAELESYQKILTNYIASLEKIVGLEKAMNLYPPKEV